MSLTVRIFLSLVCGLASGFGLAIAQPASVPGVTAVADVVGTLWLNGIRMTVIPLVVALLISSVASVADAQTLQRV
ncbi:MAG: cation:dicarboxylase symporter family transporter, partial [Acidobacteria bacterium]|nr:cation:dicarboxylase symporter family transporter [Acidobacteriota bacterium]